MRKRKTGAKQTRLIKSFFREVSALFAASLFFSMLNTGLNALTPQIVRVTVDSVIEGKASGLPVMDRLQNTPDRALLLAAVAILLVSAASGVCGYLGRTDAAKASEGFIQSLRDHLFGHIQRLPFSWHDTHRTGDIIQRCTSDVEVIRSFVSTQLLEVFRTVFLVAVSLGIMFSMNVKISLAAFVFLPVITGYSFFFYARVGTRFRAADEAEGELLSAVQENLTGVRVVRAFGRERFEVERFDRKNNAFAALWIHLGRLLSAYWGTGELITGVQVITVICFGVAETVDGRITLGQFLAFISYNAAMIWPVRGLGRILSEMSKAGVSIARVADILDAEEERDAPDASEPPMDGDIAFHHVTFGYENGKPVLSDVDFTIPAGTTFAVLGGTGSGKSTLVQLLDRLYGLPPGCGSITIGGEDTSKIRLSWLRKNIGLVLQEPFLFSRTIEENIRAVRPGAGRDEVRRAAGIARVDDAVQEFTDGYGTMVGERGVTLSGGQKQRVAIARTLMRRAPILVFDDSLSAVDAETDAQIRTALRRELGKATVILISHRVTTLMQADRILVLDGGKVAELGTHEELLRKNGIYRRVYEVQMSSGDRALLEREDA